MTDDAVTVEDAPERPRTTDAAPTTPANPAPPRIEAAAPRSAPVATGPMPMYTRDLSAFFGSHKAVENITLDFPRNTVTALIGPSGCGKSTYIRCLNRMHEMVPRARCTGSVYLRDIDIYAREADPVAVRRAVGMVFQRPNPFPTKSIADNILAGPKFTRTKLNKSERTDLVERTLRGAGLWDEVKDRLNAPGMSLSGGQQQRLVIARAIAVSPEIILMDEPCSALDPIATAKVEELIDELKANYCIIIVTHSMAQAARVSQQTAFFHLGKLVETGPTETVFTNPRESRTQDYITGRFG